MPKISLGSRIQKNTETGQFQYSETGLHALVGHSQEAFCPSQYCRLPKLSQMVAAQSVSEAQLRSRWRPHHGSAFAVLSDMAEGPAPGALEAHEALAADVDGLVVAYITVPTAEVGRRLARHLVTRRLAACVNIVPGVTSVYEWQGRLEEDAELLLVVPPCAPSWHWVLIGGADRQ